MSDLEKLHWRKSSRSSGNGGACVELAQTRTGVAVRDSKSRERGALRVSRQTFAQFSEHIRLS
ncbi:DUF397 domain-containing protein [Actinocorallia populi]|uniref:DUF397 domain-containing protein n=1 Tax=Actinocorallia populi TaxID=2079200 RepID=UPI000D08E88D|nr:DUF397 domain-containing protein [Actinocorallia populi]